MWLLDYLDYNWSVAVWVGVIALAGLAAETGVIMLLYYLNLTHEDWGKRGRIRLTLLQDSTEGIGERAAGIRDIAEASTKTPCPRFTVVP